VKTAAQIAFPRTSRKRKRPAEPPDPRLAALLADRQLWLDYGGRLAWKQELMRRRIARNARLRERRLKGYK
jgi:hypothetical protein